MSSYVSTLQFVPGDYLSFAFGKKVQSTQADNLTATDRLDGLVLCLADFHAEMNLLDLIYLLLFQVSSYRPHDVTVCFQLILHQYCDLRRYQFIFLYLTADSNFRVINLCDCVTTSNFLKLIFADFQCIQI